MDALDAIRTRRTIHAFLPKPIEFDKLVAILEAGAHAPSAGNLQDWRFIVVSDRAKIRRMPHHCGGQGCANAPAVIVVCSDPAPCQERYGPRGKLYSTQNAAAAVENMLLAAHSLGLGAVWIGAFDEVGVRTALGIPETVMVQAVLAFGYPDETPPPKQLRPLDVLVSFNMYGNRLKHIPLALHDYAHFIEQKLAERKTPVATGTKPAPSGPVSRMGLSLRRIRESIKKTRRPGPFRRA